MNHGDTDFERERRIAPGDQRAAFDAAVEARARELASGEAQRVRLETLAKESATVRQGLADITSMVGSMGDQLKEITTRLEGTIHLDSSEKQEAFNVLLAREVADRVVSRRRHVQGLAISTWVKVVGALLAVMWTSIQIYLVVVGVAHPLSAGVHH